MARETVYIRIVLKEMGHKQPPTPIQTDNSTAHGVVTNNIQPRRTKAMDMRFHWLRCRDSQGQFRYYWRPGPDNRADYWTKHHCAAHHIEHRETPHYTNTTVHTGCPASIHQQDSSHLWQGFTKLSATGRGRLNTQGSMHASKR